MWKNSTNLIHGRCTANFSHIYYLLVFRILCCYGSPLTFLSFNFLLCCFFPLAQIFSHKNTVLTNNDFWGLDYVLFCFPSPGLRSLSSLPLVSFQPLILCWWIPNLHFQHRLSTALMSYIIKCLYDGSTWKF